MIAALETPEGLIRLVMMPALFLAFLNIAMLMQRLRTSHSDTWVSLGRPAIFQGRSSSLLKFIGLGGSYRALHDTRLNWHVRVHYVLSAILVAAFLGMILLALGKAS